MSALAERNEQTLPSKQGTNTSIFHVQIVEVGTQFFLPLQAIFLYTLIDFLPCFAQTEEIFQEKASTG